MRRAWIVVIVAFALVACAALPATPTADAGPTQTVGALGALVGTQSAQVGALATQNAALQATISAPTATPAATATAILPTVTPTVAATATPRPPTSTPRPPTATLAPTPATLPKVGDTGQGQGFAVTLHEKVDPAAPGRFNGPAAGARWVAFDVSVANTGTAQIDYNPNFFRLKSVDNREYDLAFGGPEPNLSYGKQQPGDTSRGWVTFEVPEGVGLATLTYDPTFGRVRAVVFDVR
jgi:hypothetical protein